MSALNGRVLGVLLVPVRARLLAALARINLRHRFVYPGTHERAVAAPAHEDLPQRRAGAQGHRSRRRGGRFLRAARPERRRQDHGDRHRLVARHEDRRVRSSVFGYDIDRDLERAKACLGVVPQEINFNQFEKVTTILLNQAGLLRHPARNRARARRVLAQAAAALGQARRRLADAVGRHEAPADDRARADARTAPADPRRADRRRRHRSAPLDVGLPAPHQRRRHDDHPDDALSRGGRDALPQHRDHRRGPHHRERPHGDRAAQAAHGGVRAQPARAARRAACAAGLSRAADRRPHARGRGQQGTEPERHLRGADGAAASKCSACATRPTGSRSCSCGWSRDATWAAANAGDAGGRTHERRRMSRRRANAAARRRCDRAPLGRLPHDRASASSAASSASGGRRSCRRRSRRRSTS